jgi:hypothetical protein
MPRPMITFDRIAALPVPTQTWFGFDGATSIEPIEPVVIWPSPTGNQLMPASSVFQTPPPVAPW